jgi:hypothetical protein
LTNVVRDSEKVVPKAEADEDAPSPSSDPVATVDKPTKEPKESDPTNEAKKASESKSEGDES